MMMHDPKIVVDTNVLVSASILQNASELETRIKHEFYDQSIQLFSLFKKFPAKKIGHVVPKVKSEAFSVLAKAVKSAFVPEALRDAKRKEIFYNDAAAIISASEHKMRGLMKFLIDEKLDERQIQVNLKNVKNMSLYLIDEYKRYSKKGWRTKESKERSKSIMGEKHWKKDQKREVVSAYKIQINRESRQLYRFQRKHPNWQDERILAESITLKKKLERSGTKMNFMIASCDSGFFSPHIGADGASDAVTVEIFRRFKITCDYPRVIFFKSGGE